MTKPNIPAEPRDAAPASDLELRLSKYRSRLRAEARQQAVRVVDRAIDEAKRQVRKGGVA